MNGLPDTYLYSGSWGVQMELQDGKHKDPSSWFSYEPKFASNSFQGPTHGLYVTMPQLQTQNSPDHPIGNTIILYNITTTNTDPPINLGPGSWVGAGDTSSTIQQLQTLPFGINLGRENIFNGGLVFGGSYDSNRVAGNASWIKMGDAKGSAPNNDMSELLSTGRQKMNVNVQQGYLENNATVPTTIAFNSEGSGAGLQLPSGYQCGFDLYIRFNSSAQAPGLLIPGNLTDGSGGKYSTKCNVTRDSNGPMILGNTFFQAVYTYADQDGKTMYMTNANQFDLPIAPKVFDANAALTLVANGPQKTIATNKVEPWMLMVWMPFLGILSSL